jgi:hypothetical protein
MYFSGQKRTSELRNPAQVGDEVFFHLGCPSRSPFILIILFVQVQPSASCQKLDEKTTHINGVIGNFL